MYNLLFNDEKQKEMEDFFLKDLAKDGYIQNHPKKSLISPESADCIYIIISGECRQVMYGPNGKKVSYFRLTPGTIFGEMDYFDQNRTCIKTECVTGSVVSCLSGNPRKAIKRKTGNLSVFSSQ
jgi:CRP-like cAMP-binding protein